MLNQIVEAIAGGKHDGKKIKGRVILMKKNVLDFNDFNASILDGVHELFGQKVSMQLVSSFVENGLLQGKIGSPAYLEDWVTTGTILAAGESACDVEFDWDEAFGVPGAFIIKNFHHSEFYLKTLTIDQIPGHDRVHFICNSWVYPAGKYKKDRVFFVNQVLQLYSRNSMIEYHCYETLPSDTPAALRKYREEELVNLRGDGTGELKEWDRVYDYALYNDLGVPDLGKHFARPVLGGSTQYPYPRRGRTGRRPTRSG